MYEIAAKRDVLSTFIIHHKQLQCKQRY